MTGIPHIALFPTYSPQHQRRKNMKLYIGLIAACCLLPLLLAAPSAEACTGMRLKAEDGSVVFARTMEFGADTNSDMLFAPRGQSWQSAMPKDAKGMAWKNSYAFMGTNGFGLKHLVLDGINEKHMYVGAYWFAGQAEYPEFQPRLAKTSLNPADFVLWALGTCASIDDVLSKLSQIQIPAVYLEALHQVPGAHWLVVDGTGKAIAIEPLDGKLVVHDNPVGVYTNRPEFTWHLANLNNYVNLHADNIPQTKLGETTLKPFGQGNGMLGLPGDYTPPSRFVRAAFLLNSVHPAKDADGNVTLAWNLINNFSIPKGAARNFDKDGTEHDDYTQWTVVYDLTRCAVTFRTYANQDLRVARMDKLPIKGDKSLVIPMWHTKPSYKDMSGQAK